MASRRLLLRPISQTLTLTLLTRTLSSFSSSSPKSSVSVKKVTRSNFLPSLESLRTLIRESDFIAIDAEMTGVTSAPWRDSFEFDSADVRFLKLRDSATKFAVVQFGVCPFRWDSTKCSFIAHPHTFYIFPRKELPVHGLNYEFLCQTSSIDFLAKHQFDFNACIHEGISYLSRAQEEEALQKLLFANKGLSVAPLHTQEDHQSDLEIKFKNTADIFFTERMKIKFNEWRNEILSRPSDGLDNLNSKENEKIGGHLKNHFETVFFKMRPAVLLDGFTSNQLNLIRLVLRKNFKDLAFVRTPGENFSWETRVVYTDSEEDKSSLMREVEHDLRMGIKSMVGSALGFRHVIDLLSSENKLIVGHNCFLDIAHMYSKFIGPIPPTMVEFVREVRKNFPYLIDTKYIMNASQTVQYLMKRKSKALSSAFASLCPRVCGSHESGSDLYIKIEVGDVETDDEGSSCFNSGAKHEAGYDAFMTGSIFVQLCTHLGINFKLISPNNHKINLKLNDKIHPYMNHLYPTWNSSMVIDFTTGAEKPETEGYKRKFPKVIFANIVLIWSFPSNLTAKDLKDSVSKVFGPDSVTSVFCIDATSALIQFTKEEFVGDFLLLKETLEREREDSISVLHPLYVILKGGNTKVGNYDTYREICRSNLSRVSFSDQADASGVAFNLDFGSLKEGGERELESVLLPEVKRVRERKLQSKKERDRDVSCDDILDSIFSTKELFERRMKSM